MKKRKQRDPRRAASAPVAAGAPDARRTIASMVVDHLMGFFMGRYHGLYAVVMIGAASLALTVAWQQGPSRFAIAREFSRLTLRVPGRLVDSWIAVDFDPGEMQEGWRWRGAAKARPCVVIEYDAGWEKGRRRALCGRSLPFHEGYTLHDIDTIADGVPFDWKRDSEGLPIVDLWLPAEAMRWLAARPSANGSACGEPCWTCRIPWSSISPPPLSRGPSQSCASPSGPLPCAEASTMALGRLTGRAWLRLDRHAGAGPFV